MEIFETVNSVKLGDTTLCTLGDHLSLKSEDSLLRMVFHSVVIVKSFFVSSDAAY